jgi:hypothetical protein
MYPIAWGVCEGGNVIAPDSEAIFYGILDLLAKPGFSALLLWGHRNIEPGRLGLRIRDYGEDPSTQNGIGGEKSGHSINGHHNATSSQPVHSNGVTNGTTTAMDHPTTSAVNGHNGV